MKPLVSILMPAFDTAGTLGPCLRSILRQSEENWECVIVDDGSADGTLELAESFAAKDGRFSVISTPHRGIINALNLGLDRATGRFVARMDADDLMHRERLRLQVEALEAEPALAAVGCHVRVFPRARLTDGLASYERWLNEISSAAELRREAFVECPVAHPTLMIRAGVLRELRYREVDWPEDYDLLLRVLARGGEVAVVPRKLLLWRDRPNRLWRRSKRYSLERFTACKAAFLACGFLREGREYALWGYGPTGRRLRRALALHGRHPALIVELHPGRLGKTIHGARVIPPRDLAARPGLPLLVAVAGEGPRRQIRRFLAAIGFREGREFVCAA